jgi:hypothetical protein
VEDDGEDDETGDDDELEEERRLGERVADIGLGVGEGLVGRVADAKAVEDLDNDRDKGKGAYDAAWVDGGVVRDVVEDAAEDVVVLKLEEGTMCLLVFVRCITRTCIL